MKIYFKNKLGEIKSLIVLPNKATEQVTNKLQELEGIKRYNLHLHKVNISCKCEKYINWCLMEDITKLIQIENTESDACGNNGSNDSFS